MKLKKFKKLNMKFSEEGLGIRHTFHILIIILLLLLHGSDFVVERKCDLERVRLLVLPSAICGSLSKSLDLSVQNSQMRMGKTNLIGLFKEMIKHYRQFYFIL